MLILRFSKRLRAALSEVSECEQSNPGTDNLVQLSNVTRRGGRKPTKVNRSQQCGISVTRGGAAREREAPHQRLTSCQNQTRSESKRQLPRCACMQIEGTKKIWDTHRSTTTGEVKRAISMLANVAADGLAVQDSCTS